MTAKEKAIELVDKIYNTEHCGIEHFPNKNYCDCVEINYHQAKQSALIAIDEIIKGVERAFDEYEKATGIYVKNRIFYWDFYSDVKSEIYKL
jgi:hypothetical protein